MSTIHNAAKVGEIAKTVLMAGDPLRAQYIAEKFLKDVKCVSNVRNMLIFTGKYKNRRVTVMGSGMGLASMALYAHELYNFYNVQNIIRVGSCGAMNDKMELFDTVIAGSVVTDSNIGALMGVKSKALISSPTLYATACDKARKAHFRCITGRIFSSELFYHKNAESYKKMRRIGVLAVEMESYALYAEAKLAGKNALTMLAVSNIIDTEQDISVEERERALDNMIILALDTAWIS